MQVGAPVVGGLKLGKESSESIGKECVGIVLEGDEVLHHVLAGLQELADLEVAGYSIITPDIVLPWSCAGSRCHQGIVQFHTGYLLTIPWK